MIIQSEKLIFGFIFSLIFFFLPGFLTVQAVSASDKNHCIDCHANRQNGFVDAHRFAENPCVSCHLGNAGSALYEQAHQGLIAFPGNLSNADLSCAQCHPRQLASVRENKMHRGSGMVDTTRRVFDESTPHGSKADLQSLTHSPADSLLRKLCASCHLGQEKQRHAIDDTRDRGGGCLACHLQGYQPEQHPALSTTVGDGRCFGCHSRSGRISLNYSGLAEVEANPAGQGAGLSRLLDGRLVQHMPADIHQQAGMSCIDCHTAEDLMGATSLQDRGERSIDIDCQDCHANRQPTIRLEDFPQRYAFFKSRLPFAPGPEQAFLQTAAKSTPLWNIEVRGQILLLHRKLDGVVLEIPQWTAQSHRLQDQHQRLHCDSCHSQWAPQCSGCHIEYDESAYQWDHVDMKASAGRWSETRWAIDNDLPALGVDQTNQIRPFIPGMILSIEHPDWQQAKFKRIFSRLSPHTSGASRSCDSCHLSSRALGLGSGELKKTEDGWQFSAQHKILGDNLPQDAWTDLNGIYQGIATRPGARPFSRTEILRILNADTSPTD